jgi:DNA-binding GntR family transcriptional regulator
MEKTGRMVTRDNSWYQSAQNVAYQHLRQAIVSNTLHAGAPLRVSAIAKLLGISATPIREALIRLEADGLVVWRPNRGAIVAPLSAAEVRDLYEMRSVLEGLAARRAASRADEPMLVRLATTLDEIAILLQAGRYAESIAQNQQFHEAIYLQAGNPKLTETLRGLWDRTLRFRHLHADLVEDFRQAYHEHCSILAALRRQDLDNAETLTRTHVLRGAESIARHIEVTGSRP